MSLTRKNSWMCRNFLAVLGMLVASPVLTTAGQRQSDIWAGLASQRVQVGEARGATSPLTSSVVTIHVDCGNPQAKVKTIANGLKLLGNLHPALLLISGTCRENVSISGLDRITLQGNPTATIDGGSDPNQGSVVISDSRSIELIDLTITGGGQGATCNFQSLCRLTQATVQSSLGRGVVVNAGSRLDLADTVIQNNAGVGLSAVAGIVNYDGGAISGNAGDGISASGGTTLRLSPGNVSPGVVLQGNAGNGLSASLNSTVLLNAATITGNHGDGVSLQSGSDASLIGTAITNNLGHQMRIGDLSFARFAGFLSNTITGANSPDVVCDPQFSTTRQFGNLASTTTNCPVELPPTP